MTIDLTRKIDKAKLAVKHIKNPTVLQVIEIAKDLNCSERWIWEAVARCRDDAKKASKEFNQVKDITSVGLYLQWFMTTHMVLGSEMKAVWQRRLNKINATLENLRVEFGLDEKGVVISEDD